MTGPVVAIDVGTTSVRALVVDDGLNVLGRGVARAEVHHPSPGRVEQDAAQLWNATLTVVEQALTQAAIRRDAIAAIGITTQRGNVVLWDRATGSPVAPLVSWQDLRGAARAAELFAQGFMLSHLMSAAKLEAVLASVDRGRERLNDGLAAVGQPRYLSRVAPVRRQCLRDRTRSSVRDRLLRLLHRRVESRADRSAKDWIRRASLRCAIRHRAMATARLRRSACAVRSARSSRISRARRSRNVACVRAWPKLPMAPRPRLTRIPAPT